jgi:SAM-dependent methyltransferase
MKETWDERYSSDEFVYGEKPNEFFKTFIDDREPGKILMPAEGEGRNAVYAALNGWEVYAFDQSFTAKVKAKILADRYKVNISYKNADVFEFQYPIEEFDAVGVIYFHLPLDHRKVFFDQIKNSLIKGGEIVVEVFSTIIYPGIKCGPPVIALRYEKGELEEYFRDFQILISEQKDVELDEGELHKWNANVIRLIAIK